MSFDFSSPENPQVIYTYDSSGWLIERREASAADLAMTAGGVTIEPTCLVPFAFEHDEKKRLFVLKRIDGKVEHFRDNPTRYLVVEPDPETGAMRPVIRPGRPEYIYLSREEREV